MLTITSGNSDLKYKRLAPNLVKSMHACVLFTRFGANPPCLRSLFYYCIICMLTLKILGDQNMVDWGLGRLCSWDFFITLYYFFPLFERAPRTSCQNLTCHIWRDNEYVVIAQNFRELLNFY